MPAFNNDLHGSAPDRSSVALLLIDVINAFDFPEARQLLTSAMPAARKIAKLKNRAKRAGIPVVYVNDNFGRWRSDFKSTLAECQKPRRLGRQIAVLLEPQPDDYFVLKAKQSGFFASSLDLLLRYLGARSLILTGFAGDYCVFLTANDAYMRDFKLFVPSDCVASNTKQANAYALAQMRERLKADTRLSKQLRLAQTRAEK